MEGGGYPYGGGYNATGGSYPYGGGGGYGGYGTYGGGGGGGGYNYSYHQQTSGSDGSNRSSDNSTESDEDEDERGGGGGRGGGRGGHGFAPRDYSMRDEEAGSFVGGGGGGGGGGHLADRRTSTASSDNLGDSTMSPLLPPAHLPPGGMNYGLTYADLEANEQNGLLTTAVKVVAQKETPARIKTLCNILAILTGATVAPLGLFWESELFIGSLNLVLVMIPLIYVLAKNMEVDLQNKDLKQEIFALCQKLGIPAKTPGESRQTLVNVVVTFIAGCMALSAFFVLFYSKAEFAEIVAVSITSGAIIFSGVTKILSARALRKYQNELLEIKADLKMLEKQNEVTQTAIEMEQKNRQLKKELVKVKNAPRAELEQTIHNLEEQNRALIRDLERARFIVQTRVTNAIQPSIMSTEKKLKKKKKKSSKKSKK